MAKKTWRIYANPDRLDYEYRLGVGEFSVDHEIGNEKRLAKRLTLNWGKQGGCKAKKTYLGRG